MRFLAILVLTGCCALLAGSSLRSQEKETVKSNYYPLQVGTTWEYKLGEKDRFVMKVTGQEKFNDVMCAKVVTSSADGQVVLTEYLSAADDGIYRHGILLNGNKQVANKPFLILKLPAAKGNKWDVDLKINSESLKGTFTTGEGKVKVGAGEYTTLTAESKELDINGLKGSIVNHFADNVGMVKQTMQVGGAKIEIELEKFTPGK